MLQEFIEMLGQICNKKTLRRENEIVLRALGWTLMFFHL